MAARYDLKINQGETFKEMFQWLQGGGNPPENGEPVKLYGYTGRCQIRSHAQNKGVIVEIPVEITDAAKGEFNLTLTANQTKAIPAAGRNYMDVETYFYDIEFTSSDGMVYRLLNGPAIISPEVTK